jgi:hypothetical protein
VRDEALPTHTSHAKGSKTDVFVFRFFSRFSLSFSP